MCGITGDLSWETPPDAAAVAAMTARLVHRGPDAGGVVRRGPMVLGHRRLTVIDLDAASNQPLSDAVGRVWIVFNGEIYNFRELRRRLAAEAGAEFRTQGDTEVVVEAYKAWGDRFVEELNGMFAFALWDEERERLVLARDRAGEKPLYYQLREDGGVVFASELGSLRAHPAVSREVDPTAVGHFLSLGYTLTERPLLRGVAKLPPAHSMVVERGRTAVPRPYWDLAPHFADKGRFKSRGEAAEALGALVDDAVRLRMVSDVPLGAFLSGGLDSSTVVEAMTRQEGTVPRTFSIGFAEATFSELEEARTVARFLGVRHHDRIVGADAAAALRDFVAKSGEPFADTSVVPFYHLARFAREEVTVCLSGDGSDEVLAGYPTYPADRLHHLVSRLPGWLVGSARGLVDRLWPVSFAKVSFDYKLRQFLAGHALDGRRAHHHWRTIFQPAQKRALVRREHHDAAMADGFELFAPHFDRVASHHYVDQAMYVDVKTWLADDILVKVDRATMCHSLESRAPFLDHRLMELAASLPVDWKLRRLRTKDVLKRVGEGRLPRRIVHRKKAGFNAPVSHWLLGELEGFAKGVMAAGPLYAWVEPAAVEELWREHRERVADHGLRLFTLTCLALWLNEGKA